MAPPADDKTTLAINAKRGGFKLHPERLQFFPVRGLRIADKSSLSTRRNPTEGHLTAQASTFAREWACLSRKAPRSEAEKCVVALIWLHPDNSAQVPRQK